MVLQVIDTGMGIAKEHLPHIFERFWQADTSSRRKYQGTGIGLALIKELVEAQGGKIVVKSELRKGTEMTVYLPLEKGEALVTSKLLTLCHFLIGR
ncbi:MAG: ATP-binding protein [Verrucomicrobiia bacterium]